MKRLLQILLLLISNSFIAQQDPQYSLYQFNQLVINPAYAGARDGISTTLLHRNQWTGIEGAPKTTCASISSPIMNNKLGLGLTIIGDALGARNSTGIYGNFAYILKLSNKFKLSFGVSAGYNRNQFNYSALSFKTPELSSSIYQNQTSNAFDLNSGIYLRSNGFFIGLSATHLGASPLYSIKVDNGLSSLSYRLRTHTFFIIGKSFVFNENFIFAPTLTIRQSDQGANGDVNLNCFFVKRFWFGVFIRRGYGPGFLFQAYASNSLRIGYSFDSGMGNARSLGGSHEIMIGFDFAGNKSKVINPRFL
ncbi:MAG: PorP/SprF family type IX secretion system membrane protein [Bacteroidetes bacterium]|nr:PorP/SprF family type IX secretion system membrane protein [Bacteroidota bacterium]